MAANTAAHDEVHENDQDLWSGGKQPFKASYGKLMMWYFLPTWPVPDFVFSTAPFGIHGAPLIFVTFMSFLLILSSVTMVRAVQEGHRENQRGVVFWMFLTVIGGAGFLGCQAWEWTNLIYKECMTVNRNPFGTHTDNGVYLNADGTRSTAEDDVFKPGMGYLIHHAHVDDHGGGHGHGKFSGCRS